MSGAGSKIPPWVYKRWHNVEGVGTVSRRAGNSTGGCSFEPESGLVMTSENHPVEVFNYGSEAFFR